MAMEQVDVLIVGAGLSGIGAAYHLQKHCPGKTYAILEGREAIGGTWDLFRYPGIRSDSDMHTLGFVFEPWKHEKSIADGPSILEYLNRIVDERGIRDKIRFNAKVVGARTHMGVWELLAVMFVAEAVFGPAGLVAAPLFYAYLKKELQAQHLV